MFKIAEKDKNKIGIYKLLNLLNNEIYIGSTGDSFYRRFSKHLYLCKKGSLACPFLYNAMRKYGIENFEYSILEICDNNITKEELEDLEQKHMDLLNPKYNVRKIASSNLGCKHAEDAKSRLCGKAVIQYTMDGIKIREFRSMHEAERFLKRKGANSPIIKCCKGIRQFAYNSRWTYKGKKLKKFKKPKSFPQKVYIKNKDIYKEFNSQTKCAQYLNVSRQCVGNYLIKGFSNTHNIEIGVVK